MEIGTHERKFPNPHQFLLPSVMGANIELWQYKLYENGVLQVEEIHSRSEGESVSQSESDKGKNPS